MADCRIGCENDGIDGRNDADILELAPTVESETSSVQANVNPTQLLNNHAGDHISPANSQKEEGSQRARDRDERLRLARERQAVMIKKKQQELLEEIARRDAILRKKEEERRQQIEEQRRKFEEHRAVVEERRKKLEEVENERKQAIVQRNADREVKVEPRIPRRAAGAPIPMGTITPASNRGTDSGRSSSMRSAKSAYNIPTSLSKSQNDSGEGSETQKVSARARPKERSFLMEENKDELSGSRLKRMSKSTIALSSRKKSTMTVNRMQTPPDMSTSALNVSGNIDGDSGSTSPSTAQKRALSSGISTRRSRADIQGSTEALAAPKTHQLSSATSTPKLSSKSGTSPRGQSAKPHAASMSTSMIEPSGSVGGKKFTTPSSKAAIGGLVNNGTVVTTEPRGRRHVSAKPDIRRDRSAGAALGRVLPSAPGKGAAMAGKEGAAMGGKAIKGGTSTTSLAASAAKFDMKSAAKPSKKAAVSQPAAAGNQSTATNDNTLIAESDELPTINPSANEDSLKVELADVSSINQSSSANDNTLGEESDNLNLPEIALAGAVEREITDNLTSVPPQETISDKSEPVHVPTKIAQSDAKSESKSIAIDENDSDNQSAGKLVNYSETQPGTRNKPSTSSENSAECGDVINEQSDLVDMSNELNSVSEGADSSKPLQKNLTIESESDNGKTAVEVENTSAVAETLPDVAEIIPDVAEKEADVAEKTPTEKTLAGNMDKIPETRAGKTRGKTDTPKTEKNGEKEKKTDTLDRKGKSKQKAEGKGEKEGEGKSEGVVKEEEEYKQKLAEKRRVARERAEREAEEERERLEQLRIAEEERQRAEEEEERRQEEEEMRLALEARRLEEERYRQAVEEAERKREEEQQKLEAERLEKLAQEQKAVEEAEKKEKEKAEKIKREEEEKLERKKRLDSIMKRVKTDEPPAKGSAMGRSTTDLSIEPVTTCSEEQLATTPVEPLAPSSTIPFSASASSLSTESGGEGAGNFRSPLLRQMLGGRLKKSTADVSNLSTPDCENDKSEEKNQEVLERNGAGIGKKENIQEGIEMRIDEDDLVKNEEEIEENKQNDQEGIEMKLDSKDDAKDIGRDKKMNEEHKGKGLDEIESTIVGDEADNTVNDAGPKIAAMEEASVTARKQDEHQQQEGVKMKVCDSDVVKDLIDPHISLMDEASITANFQDEQQQLEETEKEIGGDIADKLGKDELENDKHEEKWQAETESQLSSNDLIMRDFLKDSNSDYPTEDQSNVPHNSENTITPENFSMQDLTSDDLIAGEQLINTSNNNLNLAGSGLKIGDFSDNSEKLKVGNTSDIAGCDISSHIIINEDISIDISKTDDDISSQNNIVEDSSRKSVDTDMIKCNGEGDLGSVGIDDIRLDLAVNSAISPVKSGNSALAGIDKGVDIKNEEEIEEDITSVTQVDIRNDELEKDMMPDTRMDIRNDEELEENIVPAAEVDLKNEDVLEEDIRPATEVGLRNEEGIKPSTGVDLINEEDIRPDMEDAIYDADDIVLDQASQIVHSVCNNAVAIVKQESIEAGCGESQQSIVDSPTNNGLISGTIDGQTVPNCGEITTQQSSIGKTEVSIVDTDITSNHVAADLKSLSDSIESAANSHIISNGLMGMGDNERASLDN